MQNAFFCWLYSSFGKNSTISFTELYTVFIASQQAKEKAHDSLSLPVCCCLFNERQWVWQKLRGSPSCLIDHQILMAGSWVDLVTLIKLVWFKKVMQGEQLWKAFSSMSELISWRGHTRKPCIKWVVCCDQVRSVQPVMWPERLSRIVST